MDGWSEAILFVFWKCGAIWLSMVAAVTDRLAELCILPSSTFRSNFPAHFASSGMSSHSSHLPPAFPTLTSQITCCKMPDLVRNEHRQKI